MSYLSAIQRTAVSLVLAAAAAICAQAAFPPVRNFEKTEYQAGTQNWDITQNSGKFIYVANNEGLLEFDGEKWTTIPIANYTNVRSVMYDNASGRIYAGIRGNEIYISHGRLQRHSWYIRDMEDSQVRRKILSPGR